MGFFSKIERGDGVHLLGGLHLAQIKKSLLNHTFMDLYPHQYYHIYNRSNNNEDVFKSPENYLFFLQKYRHYFEADFVTLA